MITIEELSFPEDDDPHVQCACIVDSVRRRLRYAERVVECAECRADIAHLGAVAFTVQDKLMACASITINDLDRITGRI